MNTITRIVKSMATVTTAAMLVVSTTPLIAQSAFERDGSILLAKAGGGGGNSGSGNGSSGQGSPGVTGGFGKGETHLERTREMKQKSYKEQPQTLSEDQLRDRDKDQLRDRDKDQDKDKDKDQDKDQDHLNQ